MRTTYLSVFILALSYQRRYFDIDRSRIISHCLPMPNPETDPFIQAFRGRFNSLLKWQDLDIFWETLKKQADAGWYIYALGEKPPISPVAAKELLHFIDEIDALLHHEHQEDYCGIVYCDSNTAPGFIKIFDPNNLGVVCGYSDNPPLPNWIISKTPPTEINANILMTQKQKRWWSKLFG